MNALKTKYIFIINHNIIVSDMKIIGIFANIYRKMYHVPGLCYFFSRDKDIENFKLCTLQKHSSLRGRASPRHLVF